MINFRLVSRIFSKNGWQIDTRSLEGFRKVMPVSDVLESAGDLCADEVMLLDAVASRFGCPTDFGAVDYSRSHFPLTVGGGIQTVDEAFSAVCRGAERIALNTINFLALRILRDISLTLGRQAVVAHIDVTWYQNQWWCVSHGGCERHSMDPLEWGVKLWDQGAGELYFHSIDCDGHLVGPDYRLLELLVNADLPFLYGGGVTGTADIETLAGISHCRGAVVGRGLRVTQNLFKDSKTDMHLCEKFWK